LLIGYYTGYEARTLRITNREVRENKWMGFRNDKKRTWRLPLGRSQHRIR